MDKRLFWSTFALMSSMSESLTMIPDFDKERPVQFREPGRRSHVRTKLPREFSYIHRGGGVYKSKPLPGRNEPCLCGSGKKFKLCCLTKSK